MDPESGSNMKKNDEKIRIKNMFNQIRKRQERSIQISGF